MGPPSRASDAGAVFGARLRHARGCPLVILWVALLAILGLFACAPERTPELLELHEVTPSALEQNARLELVGRGFPDRRRARVVFTGTLHRPGSAPRPLTLRFDAASESPSIVSLPVTRDVVARFLPDGPHGTFRGRVSVAFPSLHADAPTLTGSRDHLVLDWFNDASQHRAATEELEREARRFMEFAGFQVDENLIVAAVHPDGEAQRRGLHVGDQLVELDGVRLDGLADLVPQQGGWESRVIVRREQGEEILPLWDRSGFRPASVRDLPSALVWIAGALGLVVFSAGGRARGWAHVEDRLASRHKLIRARSALARFVAPLTEWTLPLVPSLRLAPYGVLFLVFALFSGVALEHPRLTTWVSFPTLVLATFACSLFGAFLLGGRTAGGHFRLLSALGGAALALLAFVPTLLGVAGVIWEVGSLELADLVSGQGDWPHEWRLCAAPWSLGSFLLFAASWVPVGGPRRGLGEEGNRSTLGDSLGRLFEGAALALAAGLGATLFLGGWGTTPSLPGAALFLAKTWLLLHGVLWWRALLGEVRRSEVIRSWTRPGLVASVACFAVTASAAAQGWASVYERDLRLGTLVLLALTSLLFVARAVRALARPVAPVTLNPWL